MVKTQETVFDGKVFHPIEPLALAANTHIWVTIDTAVMVENTPYSFLKTVRSLNLDGPPDWATRLTDEI
jgi:hypothetical protein